MSKKYELSRRKALAALGTIGVAGAGAGMGTSALFSDTESFTGNMMTAGELDLAVDYIVHEDQGSAGSYTINSFTGEVNGQEAEQAVTLNGDGTAMSQNLTDIKPGDSGHSVFCFTIDDNPAYLWACGGLVESKEQGPNGSGAYTEPEPRDNNGEGELEENIEVTVSYCDVTILEEPNDDGKKYTVEQTSPAFSGTLDQVLSLLSQGVPIDGKANGGNTVNNIGADTAPKVNPYPASSSEGAGPCICLEWHVPDTVGNIIQGDYLEFDIQFFATQSRHNGTNVNPCPIPTSTGDGFAKVQEEFNNGEQTTSGGARARYGNNGSSGAWELAVGDEPGFPSEFSQANYVWTSGAEVDWTVDYTASSGELSFTFDGNTLDYTLDDQPDGRIAVQGKADEATVDASVTGLSIDGNAKNLGSPTSVTATNDGDGRQVRYLVIDTDLDGSTDFEVSGTATVTLQNDYPGGDDLDEGVSFDVVLE